MADGVDRRLPEFTTATQAEKLKEQEKSVTGRSIERELGQGLLAERVDLCEGGEAARQLPTVGAELVASWAGHGRATLGRQGRAPHICF